MPQAIRKRPRIGDVIEFQTPKGLAYALFTHKHDEPPRYGALLRVFRGFHDREPEDFSKIASSEVLFSTFFPLGAACNRGIVRIVSNEDIPDSLRAFPIFKSGVSNADGKVKVWWLWDGCNEWRVGDLDEKYFSSPERGVVNDTWIIDRLLDDLDEESNTRRKLA